MPIDRSIIAKRTETKIRAMDSFLRMHEVDDKQRISRPIVTDGFKVYYILFVIFVALMLVGAVFFYLKTPDSTPASKQTANLNPWYSIKLVDGEIIYGKIVDITSDPLIIDPAYYNYDQKKATIDAKTDTPINETGDLRLVKRGAETHGPEGAIKVFRSQTIYLENLRADSKVLKVIEENERNN